MDKNIKKIIHYLFNPYLWAWLAITSMVLYVFISVVIDFQDWLTWLYATLIFPLLIGLWLMFKEESQRKETYSMDLLDLQFAGLGAALTIFLSHELGISAVIASSAVGIAGYLIIKKYAIALYCGSFAGMISSQLILTYEVLLIALICGLIVFLLKPVFRGVGGKLGTMAFISTFLFAIITQKEFLIVNNDLNFLRLTIISVLGTLISFYTQHLLKQSAIIASALPSLIFALVMVYLIKDYTACTVVFFSASFMGMSSKERIKNVYLVLIAGIIHAFMFYIYFEHYNGLGGKLGLMALTSVLITIGLYYFFLYIKNLFRKGTI